MNDPNARTSAAHRSPGPRPCQFSRNRGMHHDRLVLVETDPDVLLELLELAVTWTELDYGDAPVLPPEQWTDFASAHHWRHPTRVRRLFSLATDIALRQEATTSRTRACLGEL